VIALNNPRNIILFQHAQNNEFETLLNFPVPSLQISSIQLFVTETIRCIVLGTYSNELLVIFLTDKYNVQSQQTVTLESIAHSLQCLYISSLPYIVIGHRDGTISVYSGTFSKSLEIYSRGERPI
jgi:hypothetical protein